MPVRYFVLPTVGYKHPRGMRKDVEIPSRTEANGEIEKHDIDGMKIEYLEPFDQEPEIGDPQLVRVTYPNRAGNLAKIRTNATAEVLDGRDSEVEIVRQQVRAAYKEKVSARR